MRKRRLTVHHILPGALLAFTLCVFAPVDLYLTTADELWFSLTDLLPGLAILAAAVFIGVTLLAWLLPTKLSIAFRSAVYAGSFLLYLQGNVLVIDYGTLNGAEVNWGAYTLQYVLDAALWIAVIGLFIFLMFKFRKKFRRIAEIAACVMLVTEILTLGFSLIRNRGTQAAAGERYLSTRDEFTVSEQGNTIVFVLDTLDSHLFENLRQEHPDEIGSMLADFTFYPDTVGGSTRTKYAIPFIFSGDTNREEQSYAEYVQKGFEDSPIIRELATGKYETGFYTVSRYIDMNRDDAIGNIVEGKARPSSRKGLTKQFMKLVAFRYAPNVLARRFWMYTGEFEWYKSNAGEAAYALDDARFDEDLARNGLTVTDGKPCFRFYHLEGAHEPYVLDDQGHRAEGGSDEEHQTMGALRIVARYLEKLKEAGLYDSATIIVMADHGFHTYSSAEQTPALLVKLPGESHEFAVSELPLSYASMPEIFTAAVKQELTSLTPWRSVGTRYFYHYSEDNSLINLTEFAIDGTAWEGELRKTGVVYHANTMHLSQEYTLGTPVYFDERDTGRNHIVSGFTRNEGDCTWTEGKDAVLMFKLDKVPGKTELVLDHGTFNGEQRVVVYVNNRAVGNYTANGRTHTVIPIPEGIIQGTEVRIRLHLPDAVSPESLEIGTDERLLGISMNYVALREKK